LRVNMELQGELVMACFNSPMNITISGDENKIDRLQELLKDDDIFARKLKVSNAYHSSHMSTVAEEYLELIGDISAKPELNHSRNNDREVTMFSTVNCCPIPPTQLHD